MDLTAGLATINFTSHIKIIHQLASYQNTSRGRHVVISNFSLKLPNLIRKSLQNTRNFKVTPRPSCRGKGLKFCAEYLGFMSSRTLSIPGFCHGSEFTLSYKSLLPAINFTVNLSSEEKWKSRSVCPPILKYGFIT